MTEDPDERRERGYDAITVLLASVLFAVILGAIGFGLHNSSKLTRTIPTQATQSPAITQSDRLPTSFDAGTTGSR